MMQTEYDASRSRNVDKTYCDTCRREIMYPFLRRQINGTDACVPCYNKHHYDSVEHVSESWMRRRENLGLGSAGIRIN
jgi:hypothetical protein